MFQDNHQSQKRTKQPYSFKILAHPADVRLQIKAGAKDGLFQAALLGMVSILYHQPLTEKSTIEENITISSLDLDMLLVDFLNEVLAKTDIFQAIFNKLEIKELSDNSLRAKIWGQKVDYFDQEIKAATYGELKMRQAHGHYEITILFDI